MTTLYYATGACSLAPHIVLEWIGAPYEAVKVQFGSKELLAVNPAGAVPTLRELLSSRSKVAEQAFRTLAGPPRFEPYDPERATTFERFDRAYTDARLSLIRHGEVRPLGTPPPPGLRASTVVASLAASIRHRRRRR